MLFVIIDDPVSRPHSILVLHLVHVFALLEARKVKEVDGVKVEFGDEIWIDNIFRRHCQLRNHLFCVKNELIRVAYDRLIFDVLSPLVLNLGTLLDREHLLELFQGKISDMRIDVSHHGRVVGLQCIVEFLRDLGHYRCKLIDECETVVEVHVGNLFRPGCYLEGSHSFTV